MLDDLKLDRLDSVSRKIDRLSAEERALKKRIDTLKSEISSGRDRIAVLEKVEELFKFLLDKYVHQYAESFSAVVTEGLQAIFHDQDLEFEVVVSQKRGKIWIDFETVQNGVRGPSLEAFGGGVSSVQSLLLRILVLLKSGLARYLILDESLAALSEEYVGNAGEFIAKMCDELGVTVLLITHNKAFLDHADKAYIAKPSPVNGVERTVLEEISGSYHEE